MIRHATNLALFVSLAMGVSPAAGQAPAIDVMLHVGELAHVGASAGASPLAGSPWAVLGLGPAEAGATGRPEVLVGPDGALTSVGRAAWSALARSELAIQARRTSREGMSAAWYGASATEVWGLAPQADGLVRVFGPFPRAELVAVLAARLALPEPAKASPLGTDGFSLVEWLLVVGVERETLAAAAVEAGRTHELGWTIDELRSVLVRPATLANLAADRDLDLATLLADASSPATLASTAKSLVDRGWLTSVRGELGLRFHFSERGRALARIVLHPRFTLQIAARQCGPVASERAATRSVCVADEGTAIVAYDPVGRRFSVVGVAPAELAATQARELGAMLAELDSRPDSGTRGSSDGASLLGDEIKAELERGAERTRPVVATRALWGRGKPDCWCVAVRDGKSIDVEYEDTDGDDLPDLVRVRDVDGAPFTRSFVLHDKLWQESNILEAYLEVSFKLPWGREVYQPHDVDVLLNGKVVAQLTSVVPEGLYQFRVRPQDLVVNADAARTNDVRVQTRHLRGGHYVVSTDFNLAVRLSQVSRWVVAEDAAAAEKVLRERSRLRAAGVDLAVYANGWAVAPAVPRPGERVTVRGIVHNRGMERAAGWTARFSDGDLARGGVAFADVALAPIEPGETLAVEGAWTASPGSHALCVVLIAPAGATDLRAANDQVRLMLTTGGDESPPEVAWAEPAEGALVPAGRVTVRGTAMDNVAVVALEVSIDGGLWQAVPVAPRWEATIEIGPGAHRLRARARDGAGRETTVERSVTAR